MIEQRRPRCGHPRRRQVAGAALTLLALAACAQPPAAPAPVAQPVRPSPEVHRRADEARRRVLEQEIERLRADLDSAEQTLVAVESGLRGAQTRTQAVSMLAETRIQVERAAERAPWRSAEAHEARAKLAEAERQLAEDHVGSAVFFVTRASRIAKTLLVEAERVRATPGARAIAAERVNLREEPSTRSGVLAVLPARLPVFPELEDGEWVLVRTVAGQLGWVHGRLLRRL